MLDLNTWVIVFVIATVVLLIVVAAVVLWEAFR
jgi:FtsZ-interacting cell division protein ZipA